MLSEFFFLWSDQESSVRYILYHTHSDRFASHDIVLKWPITSFPSARLITHLSYTATYIPSQSHVQMFQTSLLTILQAAVKCRDVRNLGIGTTLWWKIPQLVKEEVENAS